MAVGVTAAYNGSYHSPGFDISVSGLSGYDSLTIERIDLLGEYPDTPVRGADAVSITGSVFAVSDYEAPPGRPTAYRASASTTTILDTFGRTEASTWGSVGSVAWSATGSATHSVSSGVGKHTHSAANTLSSDLLQTAATDQLVFTEFQLPALPAGPAGASVWLLGRADDSSNYYAATVGVNTSGGMTLYIQRRIGGVLTGLVFASGVGTYVAGQWWSVQLEISGSQLRARVWRTGTTVPAWQAVAIDFSLTSGTKAGVASRTEAGSTGPYPFVVNFDNWSVTGINGSAGLEESATSSSDTIPIQHAGESWLKSVGQPALNRRVNISDFSDTSRPGRVLAQYEVLGRRNKVVLTDVLGGREGTLVFATFPMGSGWHNDSSWHDLEMLLDFGGTLLLQTAGADLTGEHSLFFEVTDYQRKRIGPVGGEIVHLHSVSFIEVDRPATTQQALSLRSWQSVLDQNSSWQDVLSNHTSWLDVLQRDL